jgi:hypothetical protein
MESVSGVEKQNDLLPCGGKEKRAHLFDCEQGANVAVQAGISRAYQATGLAHGSPGTGQKQEHLLRIATDGRKLPTPVLSGSGRGYNLSPTHGAPLFHCDH